MKKPRRKLLGRFVEMRWWDAQSKLDWIEYKSPEWEKLGACPVTTRGWVVKETARALTLAGTVSNDGRSWDFSEVITIPRAWGTIKVIDKRRLNFHVRTHP